MSWGCSCWQSHEGLSDRGRTFGRRAWRGTDSGLGRSGPRLQIRRRGRRGHDGSGPRLALPHVRPVGYGVGRGAAAHVAAAPPHRADGAGDCGSAPRYGRDHRQPGFLPAGVAKGPRRATRAAGGALCCALCLGVAAKARRAHGPLGRSCAGPVAVRGALYAAPRACLAISWATRWFPRRARPQQRRRRSANQTRSPWRCPARGVAKSRGLRRGSGRRWVRHCRRGRRCLCPRSPRRLITCARRWRHGPSRRRS